LKHENSRAKERPVDQNTHCCVCPSIDFEFVSENMRFDYSVSIEPKTRFALKEKSALQIDSLMSSEFARWFSKNWTSLHYLNRRDRLICEPFRSKVSWSTDFVLFCWDWPSQLTHSRELWNLKVASREEGIGLLHQSPLYTSHSKAGAMEAAESGSHKVRRGVSVINQRRSVQGSNKLTQQVQTQLESSLSG